MDEDTRTQLLSPLKEAIAAAKQGSEPSGGDEPADEDVVDEDVVDEGDDVVIEELV